MDGDDGDEDNAQGSFSAGRREVKAEATTAAAATGIAARFGRAGHVPPAQCSLPA
jgi:3-deoxy-D-manno-octulosonic acid (KDO) 8-phosphate synthase